MKAKIYLPIVIATTALAILPVIGFEYDEATQGDIAAHGLNGSIPIFHLDVGTNVIRGSTHVGIGGDPDTFRFQVPNGAVINMDSIVYDYELTSATGLNYMGVSTFIGTGQPDSTPLFGAGFPENGGSLFYVYSDGSFPGTEATPSPVNLQLYQFIDSQVDLNFPAAPLQPGIYWFRQGARFSFPGLEGDAAWNYTITIVVSPAP
jgi:hypothetical protein